MATHIRSSKYLSDAVEDKLHKLQHGKEYKVRYFMISLLKDLKHIDYHHCKQRTLCFCGCHFIPQINQYKKRKN